MVDLLVSQEATSSLLQKETGSVRVEDLSDGIYLFVIMKKSKMDLHSVLF